MVMQGEHTGVYPGSGKRRPYVQRGEKFVFPCTEVQLLYHCSYGDEEYSMPVFTSSKKKKYCANKRFSVTSNLRYMHGVLNVDEIKN
jgi:hypothetical protein